MPIDANTALADLNRLIENLGGRKENGDPSRKSTVQTGENLGDFGRFGQGFDSQERLLSNDKGMKNTADLTFGQFGQQKSKNEHTERHPNSVDDKKSGETK